MSFIDDAQEPDVDKATEREGYGSLERGIAGDYVFSIGGTLSEAWEKTAGAKWTIQLAMSIYFMILAAFAVVPLLFPSNVIIALIIFLLSSAVSNLLWAGLYKIGIRRSVDAPIQAGQVLSYFSDMFPLLLLSIVVTLMTVMGFVLLIIPGVYLTIAYLLAVPLMVDKKMGFWQAMEASRKAITKRWFAVFGLMLVLSLINFVAMIPLGIGLIWSGPMSVIAWGILYRNIFGISDQTLA